MLAKQWFYNETSKESRHSKQVFSTALTEIFVFHWRCHTLGNTFEKKVCSKSARLIWGKNISVMILRTPAKQNISKMLLKTIWLSEVCSYQAHGRKNWVKWKLVRYLILKQVTSHLQHMHFLNHQVTIKAPTCINPLITASHLTTLSWRWGTTVCPKSGQFSMFLSANSYTSEVLAGTNTQLSSEC